MGLIVRFRQYGLWERYAELYPDEDLIYTVGVSDYSKDWFFAQVTRFDIHKRHSSFIYLYFFLSCDSCVDKERITILSFMQILAEFQFNFFFFFLIDRKIDDKSYQGSTWQIRFNLDNVEETQTYTLRIALATAHMSELQVCQFSN